MSSFDQTMKFNFPEESMEQEVKQVMLKVHSSLEEKGYNPINQIVGYLLSGDPAYIPRHQDARNLIRKLERDEILEELVKFYIKRTTRTRNENYGIRRWVKTVGVAVSDALGWTAQGIETVKLMKLTASSALTV